MLSTSASSKLYKFKCFSPFQLLLSVWLSLLLVINQKFKIQTNLFIVLTCQHLLTHYHACEYLLLFFNIWNICMATTGWVTFPSMLFHNFLKKLNSNAYIETDVWQRMPCLCSTCVRAACYLYIDFLLDWWKLILIDIGTNYSWLADIGILLLVSESCLGHVEVWTCHHIN